MKKYGFVLLLLLFVSFSQLYAQSGGLIIYNMNRLPQSTHMNPAKFPKGSKGYLSTTSTNYTMVLPFSYDDAIFRDTNDTLRFSMDRLLSRLDETSKLSFSLNLQLFGAGFKFQKFFFTFSAAARGSANLLISKNLVNFLAKGNQMDLDKPLELVKNGFGGTVAWTEFGVGAGYQITPRLSVGVKPKLVYGLFDIQTGDTYFNIQKEPGAAVISARYRVDVKKSATSFSDDITFSNLFRSDIFKNRGMSFDVGASFDVTDKLNVAASVVDWGSIRWSTNTTQYKSPTNSEELSFEGFNWDNLMQGGEYNSDIFQQFADTLESKIKINTIDSIGSYRTALPTKVFLSASYQLLKRLKVSGVYQGELSDNFSLSTFSLSADVSVAKWLDLGVGNTFVGKSMLNPSLGFVAAIKNTVQLYSFVDFSSLSMKKNKTYSGHFGLNILFGKPATG